MVEFYSEEYDRDIDLTREESVLLIGIYLEISKERGFTPILGEGEEELLLYSGASYFDEVAYQVELYGKGKEGYRYIEYLFEN